MVIGVHYLEYLLGQTGLTGLGKGLAEIAFRKLKTSREEVEEELALLSSTLLRI